MDEKTGKCSLIVLAKALNSEVAQVAIHENTIKSLQTQITKIEGLSKEATARIVELKDAMAKIKGSASKEVKKEEQGK